MTTKCTGLMGRIFGHRFRPVITTGSPTITDLKLTGSQAASAYERIINATKSETFHGCICQRCGIRSESQSSLPPRNDEQLKPGVHNCTWDNRRLGDPVMLPLANGKGGNDEK